MTLATYESVVALLNIKEDPLSVEERLRRRILMLTLVGTPENGGAAQDYLVLFRDTLVRFSPADLVSTFPEKDFNALTVIEYLLNTVRFFIDPEVLMPDVTDVMKYWFFTIANVMTLLKESSSLDEDQALRVRTLYKDIASAVQHGKRFVEEAGSSDTKAEHSKPLAPIFTTPFASDSEKKFMTRLREIYTTGQKLPTTNIFQNLEDLCKSTDLSHVTSSDFQTHAAFLMIISIIDLALSSRCYNDLDLERYKFLLSSTKKLNSSSFPNTSVSICFRDFVIYRMNRVQGLMERAHAMFSEPSDDSKLLGGKTPASTRSGFRKSVRSVKWCTYKSEMSEFRAPSADFEFMDFNLEMVPTSAFHKHEVGSEFKDFNPGSIDSAYWSKTADSKVLDETNFVI